MKIELGENDSLLFEDGIPRSIVVTVITDGGKKHVFPYPSEKSMSALYADVKRLTGLTGEQVKISSALSLETLPSVPTETPAPAPPISSNPNEIEAEDIVRCVNVFSRYDGPGQPPTVELQTGAEYRVLKVHRMMVDVPGQGQIRQATGYDIINDNAPVPKRVTVFPNEVVLVRKRAPAAPKVLKFEMMAACGYCGTDNALAIDEIRNIYVGSCSKCGKLIEAERPKAVKK